MNDYVHISFCSCIGVSIEWIVLEMGSLGPRVDAFTIHLGVEFICISARSSSHGTWSLYSVNDLFHEEIYERHFFWVSGHLALLQSQTHFKAIINPPSYTHYKVSIPLERTFFEKDFGYFYNQIHTEHFTYAFVVALQTHT